jgi:FlaA1/EpsC-like NDP-sugar epimerase/lipopolysaccharide/colanic/teichoic acid biosynthesis glycosyltransferase
MWIEWSAHCTTSPASTVDECRLILANVSHDSEKSWDAVPAGEISEANHSMKHASAPMSQSLYLRTGKRWFDAACALIGLVVLSPFLFLVAFFVKFTSRGPAFFRQVRVGQFGRPFRIFKFRTMKEVRSGSCSFLTAEGDPRITPIGKWLRKAKIDELPQLINVLMGDMSIVGPRPEVPRYTAEYTVRQKKILLVKPGITGPSVIVGEEELLASHLNKEIFYLTTILPAKLDIDIAYCERINFMEDVKLILLTFWKIFARSRDRSEHLQHLSKTHAEFLTTGVGKTSALPSQITSDFHHTMNLSSKFYSRTNQVILDAGAFVISLLLAYFIRFESWPSGSDRSQLLLWLPLLVSARLLVYFALGIYRQVWKFVSFSDAIEIAKSIAVVSAALAAMRLLLPGHTVISQSLRLPLSVIALEGLLSLALTMAIRALRRVLYSRQRRAEAASGLPSKRVLLYGAGRAGIMLCKELETNRTYDVVGFVDDDPRKVGSTICNVRVVGNGDQLTQLVEKHVVDEIIISMATATRMTLAQALARCRRAGIPAKIIPSLQEILTGQVQISQLRETRVEEVLGRDSVEVLEFQQLAGSTYEGRRVLVTGAGGSIGSELARQLVRLAPSKIAILDKDENSIYELEQELRLRKTPVPVEPHIADVREAHRLRAIFQDFRPQVVFHAAAHKHVPLMEMHPCEAVLNNVGGTKNTLDVSEEFGVERFVFISSDKAVNPANVMGATKRIGEMLVQASINSKGVRFACVRFGNVLGSRGSVVPLFQKQIAEGGPVTVTHPDVVRYFMTIQEAVQLILCAGTMARGGEIFVLDMGNPRNILELAREMILLAGLEPEKDIETKIVGLRPGEKLWEELVAPSETVLETPFEKLSLIEPRPFNQRALMDQIAALLQIARNNDGQAVHQILSSMDLGFCSQKPKVLAAAASN